MTPDPTNSPNSEPLPPGVALPGLEALIPLAKQLHDRGLSPPEIKAAIMKALEMHRGKTRGKSPSKLNLGEPGPMPESGPTPTLPPFRPPKNPLETLPPRRLWGTKPTPE